MRIVLFCGKGASSNIVATYLNENFDLVGVFSEQPQSSKKLLKRRIKKLGYFTVVGQLAFMFGMVPLLRLFSKKRILELRNQLPNDNLMALPNVIQTNSINDASVIEKVGFLKPDVIVVNGTRIISKKMIESLQLVPMINIHVGITPIYRGVHGGYWALANEDLKNFGVTVHYIDTGIDTGSVIVQKRLQPSSKDTFVTYPLLQLKGGLECLSIALKKIKENDFTTIDTSTSSSKLYYHPTLIKYLYNYIIKGVK